MLRSSQLCQCAVVVAAFAVGNAEFDMSQPDAVEILGRLKGTQGFLIPARGLLGLPDLGVGVPDVQEKAPRQGKVGVADLAQEAVALLKILPGGGEITLEILDQPERVIDPY